MGRSQTFSCRADAAAAFVAAEVVSIRTEGFHVPGDGGGASYRRVSSRPPHGGFLHSGDGAWWEICGPDFSARQFGALGDGVSDDSDALQAALDCPLVTALRIPAGRYRAIGLRLRRTCVLVGEAAELFWDVPGDSRDLLHIQARGANVRGLTLTGLRYIDLETRVSPYTLLRIEPHSPEDAGEVRLQDLTFVGGSIGCLIGLVSNVFIDRVRFEYCRNFALILARGPRQIIINGLVATGIGAYGGIKTDFAGTVRATERLVLNDFVVADCGRGSPDPSDWQEGVDLDCAFAREWVISNGIVSNCGAGGICLKTGGGIILDEEDVFQDMVLSNLVIAVPGNRVGICLEWTGGKVNTMKRGRRMVIAGNTIRHEGADGTSGCGIQVTAWSEIHITNNYIEGAHAGIVLGATGSSDDTIRNISITGNHIREVQMGIVAMPPSSSRNGAVEGLEVSGNSISCAQIGIQLSGARCSDVVIAHNRIRQRGRHENLMACIQVRNAPEVEVWNNFLESERGSALMVMDRTYGVSGGTVLRNVVRCAAAPFLLGSGQWEVFENYVRAAPDIPTLDCSADARVSAAWNVRGIRAAPPTDRGSAGDVVLSAGCIAPPPGWWFAAEMQGESGSWKQLAAHLSPRESQGGLAGTSVPSAAAKQSAGRKPSIDVFARRLREMTLWARLSSSIARRKV